LCCRPLWLLTPRAPPASCRHPTQPRFFAATISGVAVLVRAALYACRVLDSSSSRRRLGRKPEYTWTWRSWHSCSPPLRGRGRTCFLPSRPILSPAASCTSCSALPVRLFLVQGWPVSGRAAMGVRSGGARVAQSSRRLRAWPAAHLADHDALLGHFWSMRRRRAHRNSATGCIVLKLRARRGAENPDGGGPHDFNSADRRPEAGYCATDFLIIAVNDDGTRPHSSGFSPSTNTPSNRRCNHLRRLRRRQTRGSGPARQRSFQYKDHAPYPHRH